MRRNTGAALASTLLVVLFLVVFGFTLANLATFDLSTVSRNGQKQLAFEAAQAGLDGVIGRLSRDPRIGTSEEVFEETLSDGSSFRVSFDSSDSGPWCVNNLGSFSSATGFNGRTVPGLHASLFSVGTSPSGQETSIVECLIRLESIPYAVAGTGTVNLASTQVVGFPSSADTSETLEAHVYSGAPGGGSLTLGGASNVSGDARSVGGIFLGPLANVAGDVEQNQEPENLPKLDIEDYREDIRDREGVDIREGDEFQNPILRGPVYIQGDTTFVAAVMDDAVIFVEGDLTVVGLTGSGTIFVTEETTFGASLTLDNLNEPRNRLTLFSRGDINIAGGAMTGVLFSNGNVTSTAGLTVLGAVYAVNEADSSRGNVSLGLLSSVSHVSDSTSFASYWLGIGGEADAIRVYWRRLR